MNHKILHSFSYGPEAPFEVALLRISHGGLEAIQFARLGDRQHGESIPRHSPPKPFYPAFFPNAPHPPETHQAISQTTGSGHHAPSLPSPSLCVLDMGHAPHAEQRAPREQTRAIHSSKNTARNHGCLQSGRQPWRSTPCRMGITPLSYGPSIQAKPEGGFRCHSSSGQPTNFKIHKKCPPPTNHKIAMKSILSASITQACQMCVSGKGNNLLR